MRRFAEALGQAVGIMVVLTATALIALVLAKFLTIVLEAMF